MPPPFSGSRARRVQRTTPSDVGSPDATPSGNAEGWKRDRPEVRRAAPIPSRARPPVSRIATVQPTLEQRVETDLIGHRLSSVADGAVAPGSGSWRGCLRCPAPRNGASLRRKSSQQCSGDLDFREDLSPARLANTCRPTPGIPAERGFMRAASGAGFGFRVFTIEGRPNPATEGGEWPSADLRTAVSPNYLAALGVPLIEGRAFTEADSRGARRAARRARQPAPGRDLVAGRDRSRPAHPVPGQSGKRRPPVAGSGQKAPTRWRAPSGRNRSRCCRSWVQRGAATARRVPRRSRRPHEGHHSVAPRRRQPGRLPPAAFLGAGAAKDEGACCSCPRGTRSRRRGRRRG